MPGYNPHVAQETLVYKVRPEHAALIEGRIDPGRFEFRSTPYARFSAKGDGVVVTLYTSGKLVVQGADPAVFVERYAPEASAVKGKTKAKKSASKPRVIAPYTGGQPLYRERCEAVANEDYAGMEFSA